MNNSIKLKSSIKKENIHELRNKLNSVKILNINPKLFFDIIPYIEKWIYLHTNYMIIDKGFLPLFGHEEIKIINIGGLIWPIYEGKSIEDYYKTNLLIKTFSTNRFELLEKYVIISLIHILDFITNLFTFPDKKIHKTKHVEIFKTNNELLNKAKRIFGLSYFPYTINFYLGKEKENNIQYFNSQLINEAVELIKEISNTNDLMLKPYDYYFEKKITNAKIDYNDAFSITIKNHLRELINGIKSNNKECKSEYIYSTINGIKRRNINIPEKKFCIEVNQTYALLLKDRKLYNDYDTITIKNSDNALLLRMKIIRFDDFCYQNYINEKTIIINNLHFYSKEELIKDTFYTIFNKHHFLPWYYPKYKEILFNLFSFLSHDELRILIEILNKKYPRYRLLVNFDHNTIRRIAESTLRIAESTLRIAESTSFYNLIDLNSIIFDKYYIIHYPIEFFILMDNLIINEKFDNIMYQYSKIYGFINPKNVRENYIKFRKEMLAFLYGFYNKK